MPTSIHLRSLPPEQVVDTVLNGAVNIGVSSLPLEHCGIAVHRIGEAQCMAVLHEDDPLPMSERSDASGRSASPARPDRIVLNDFAGWRLVTMQPQAPLPRFILHDADLQLFHPTSESAA